jgi:hypothetical protein
MTQELVNKSDVLARLNAMDNEYGADKGNVFGQLPRLEIDNRKVTQLITLPDGSKREEDLLCAPAFVEASGKEEEYKKELFADTFNGIIMATTYKIVRKGDKETIKRFPSFFHGLEFFNYDGECVVLRSGAGENMKESFPMTWKAFSEMYKGTYTRFTYCYVLIEGKLHILAIKSESGRILNKYKNKLKMAGSNAILHNTKFSLETDRTGDIAYNKLVLESAGEIDPSKIEEVITMREELLRTIRENNTPRTKQERLSDTPVQAINALAEAGMITEAQRDAVINDDEAPMPEPTF